MSKTTLPFYPKNPLKRKITISLRKESDKPIKRLKTAKIPVTECLKSIVCKVEKMVPPHIELTPPGDTKSVSFNNQDTKEISPTFIDLHQTGTTDNAINPGDTKSNNQDTKEVSPTDLHQTGKAGNEKNSGDTRNNSISFNQDGAAKTQINMKDIKLKKNSLKRNKQGKITDFYNWPIISDTSSEDEETSEDNQPYNDENLSECDKETKILRVLNDNFLEFINTERKIITAKQLDLSYFRMFDKSVADNIYQELEKQMEYFTGELTRVNIQGQWKDIPRKQVAYGNDGLTYTFSGNTLPARPWVPLLETLCRIVSEVAKAEYNFVLVNRYNSGQDHIGEHRDDEPDLDPNVPIASLSFGQEREFLLRHKDLRFKKSTLIPEKRIPLEHGSLLLMHYPTNFFWFHSLPRCSALHPRINLTFRKILPKSEQTPYVKKTYQGPYRKYGNSSYHNKGQWQQKDVSAYQPKVNQWPQRTGSPYEQDKQWQKGAKSPYQQDKQNQPQQSAESPSQQEKQWEQIEKSHYQKRAQFPWQEKRVQRGTESPYQQHKQKGTNSPYEVDKPKHSSSSSSSEEEEEEEEATDSPNKVDKPKHSEEEAADSP